MSKVGKDLIAGMKEALAYARGELKNVRVDTFYRGIRMPKLKNTKPLTEAEQDLMSHAADLTVLAAGLERQSADKDTIQALRYAAHDLSRVAKVLRDLDARETKPDPRLRKKRKKAKVAKAK